MFRKLASYLALWPVILLFGACNRLETLRDPQELRSPAVDQALRVTPLADPNALLTSQELVLSEHRAKYGRKVFIIRRVLVNNRPISTKDEIIPQIINFFHTTTEEDLIRQEVLLLPGGDRLSTIGLLMESERNLRGIGYFKSVEMVFYPLDAAKLAEAPPGADIPDTETLEAERRRANREYPDAETEFIDLGIITSDRITNTAAFNLGTNGGNSNIFVSVGEVNLFGRGIVAHGSYNRINNLNIAEQIVGQKRVLGSYWNLYERSAHHVYNGRHIRNSARLEWVRPFYSLSTPWSYSTDLSVSAGDVVNFEAGKERPIRERDGTNTGYSSVYDREDASFEQRFSRAWGGRYRTVLTAGAGQTVRRYAFRDAVPNRYAEDYLPHGEEARYLLGEAGISTIRYLKTRNFKKFVFDEDIRLGFYSKVAGAQALSFLGLPDDYTRLSQEAAYADNFGQHFFYDLTLYNRNEKNGGLWRDNVSSALAAFYWGFSPLGYFANHGKFSMGSRLYSQSIFENSTAELRSLSSSSIGMPYNDQGQDIRGLPAGLYRGDRKALVSLEFRTRPLRFWYAAFGFVGFTDWGDVWYENTRDPRIKGTVGVGLRFEWVEFDNNLLRFDLGFPVYGAKYTKFAISQSFGLNHSF